MDQEIKTASGTKLPGILHIIEASLFFGAIGGLADVSYLLTRYPTVSADIPATLRFITAAFLLTSVAMFIFLAIFLAIVIPIAKSKKWNLELSLATLYASAALPASIILTRNIAKLVAEESILVTELRILIYFLKYIWIVIPLCWAIGVWLAGIRVRFERYKLFYRVSAIVLSAGFYLIASISVQQNLLLARANVESQVSAGIENSIITVLIFVVAIILLPILNFIFSFAGKFRNGIALKIFWVLFLIVPFIPPLIIGQSLAGTDLSVVGISEHPYNVILVSLDTVRYDDVGFNGSEIVKTPNLDAVAAESYIFDNAIVPFPMTGPSHISMFTGLQPDSETGHGVKSNGVPLADGIPTLATILNENGYNTGAIIGSSILSRQSCGLERGFNYYNDIFNTSFRARFLPDQIWLLTVSKIFRRLFNIKEGIPQGLTKTADVVTDQAIDWLENNSSDPFFLFVHYYDAHYGYAPPPPFDTMYMPDYHGPFRDNLPDYNTLTQELDTLTDDDIEYFHSLYRGEISFIDQEMKRLLDWGDSNGIWDNTMLIIVSDHGESFEHDYLFSHTDRVYDQLIHVPLIIRYPNPNSASFTPGNGGPRIPWLVNVSDIYATVLNYVGIESPREIGDMNANAPGVVENWDHDLIGLSGVEVDEYSTSVAGQEVIIKQEPGWNYVASQAYLFDNPNLPELSMGRFFSFRGPNWHLIYGPEAEPTLPMFQFFNLKSDPEEMNNIYPDHGLSTPGWPGIQSELELWGKKVVNYGLVVSAGVDPIEKKPLYNFHPGTGVLSFGGIGCNLSCLHCQNASISTPRITRMDALRGMEDGPMRPEDVIKAAVSQKAEGVAFTYNEHTIWFEWALDVSKLAKEKGLYTVFVTNAYIEKEPLDELGPYVDAYAADLKGWGQDFHTRFCKIPRWEKILDAIDRAKNVHGMHVEVTTNIVPGFNDDNESLENIAKWIFEKLGPLTAWHVSRFIPHHKLMHLEATPEETLLKAREIGLEAGLKHVYIGNVAGLESGNDTFCPKCGNLLIKRSGYHTRITGLDGEKCAKCGGETGIVR
ncbi:MAG: AmmeMemoRadiSam system radical SAM enzyme [bacterium]|nr:AmmeMemoRadiSam system radical SAM enzyme [bacterium]